MARGGPRVGAGRPRNDADAHWLGGDAGKRGRAFEPVREAVTEFVGPPEGLSELHREVWLALAPEAMRKGTLTKASERAFRDLCEAIVVRDGLLTAIHQSGYLVDKGSSKHPLLGEWRQLSHQVRTAMKEFRLAPLGKPMEDQPEEPVDPFSEFDGQVQ